MAGAMFAAAGSSAMSSGASIPEMGLGLFGTLHSAKRASHEAAESRRFQVLMRKTKYQDTVEDMRKAGLNPSLALGNGPSSAPAGTVAQVPDFAKSVHSARSNSIANESMKQTVKKQKKEVDLVDEQIETTKQTRQPQIDLMEANMHSAQGQARHQQAMGNQVEYGLPFHKNLQDIYSSPAGKGKQWFDAGVSSAQGAVNLMNPLKGMFNTFKKGWGSK